MSTTTALELHDAVAVHGRVRAVDGVDLDVSAGEIVALVGPSGCGKSTLLRAVAGLHPLAEGSIRVAGVLVDDGRRHVPPERRGVGLVFQEHSLFPHLTVLDNVVFGIRDAGRTEASDRAREALALVELVHHDDRYPHELSGGERQRIALARALAPRPSLLLLDEPFASLDPNLRAQLRRDVVDVLRSTGTPAVFVTHDQTEALTVGDRIVVLRDGRIEQVGHPSEVFHRPTNRFVGAFMGEASFLPIHRTAAGADTALGRIELADGDTRSMAMVRPDDLVFEERSDGSARVCGVEFLGDHWRCAIELADGSPVVVMRSHLRPLDVGARGDVGLVAGHRPVPVASTDD